MPVLPSESPPPSSRAQSDQLVTLLAASQHAGSSPPAGLILMIMMVVGEMIVTISMSLTCQTCSGVQFSPRPAPTHPSIVATAQQQQQQQQQQQAPTHHQPVFGASPMGLLPAAGVRPGVQQQSPDQLSGQLDHLTHHHHHHHQQHCHHHHFHHHQVS